MTRTKSAAKATKTRAPPSCGLSDDAVAAVAKALGHPARIAIVRLLLARRACICGDIVAELPYAQSTVSQHLKVLKDAGVIQGTIDGPRVCYCLDPRVLAGFAAVTGALAAAAPVDLDDNASEAGCC
jgi:predicted transcriptional regulator